MPAMKQSVSVQICYSSCEFGCCLYSEYHIRCPFIDKVNSENLYLVREGTLHFIGQRHQVSIFNCVIDMSIK